MNKHPLFTHEKHIEMLEARERLRAIKDKVQPYPLFDQPEMEIYYPPAPPEHRLYDRLNQLEGRVLHLEKKFYEHTDRVKRKSYKYK